MNLFRDLPRLSATLAAALLSSATLAQGARPADLVEVYAEALASNAALKASLAEVEIGNQALAASEGRLLPQIGLRGSYDYVSEQIEGDFFGVVAIDSEDDFTRGLLGVRLTQPLYHPELGIQRDQAELRQTQARLKLDEDEDKLLVGVAGAYFAVLGARDSVRFAEAEQEAVQRVLEQVTTRFSAGLVTEADYQAARAQQSLSAARLAEARGNQEAAFAVLDVVAGKPFRVLKALPEGMVLARPEPPDVKVWGERARAQNLTVLTARVDLEIARREREKAGGLRWPKVDLNGDAFFLDSGGGLSGDRQETEQRIGVALTLPLYSGGSVSAAIAAAEAGAARAQALLEAAEAAAERDARVAYLKAIAGVGRVPALKDAVEAARSAEAATGAGFEAGTRTDDEVLRALEKRYEVERDYSAARYQFMLDSLRLKQAAGNLAIADLSRFDRVLRAEPAIPASAR